MTRCMTASEPFHNAETTSGLFTV
eukprot:COSAG01_NODE_65415_length_273_cov_0.873563_2_plen_23_part_01